MNGNLMMIAAAAVAAAVGAVRGAEVYSVPDGERIYGGYTVAVDGVAVPVSEVRCSTTTSGMDYTCCE